MRPACAESIARDNSGHRLACAWLVAFVVVPAAVRGVGASAADEGPVGWASVDGGTTGGAGGPTARIADGKSLVAALRGDEPAIVVVTGPVKLPGMVRVGSNKTIRGDGPDAALTGGGLNLDGVHNVVVRYLSFRDSPDDAINVQDGSHHVWIDRCDLSRAKDGLVDIKRASDLVTVSWCRFHDHHKTCLLGHSDNPDALAADRGRLRVTYHHNFFDGTRTRHPRVRAGETVHVFNNWFRGNEYGMASTEGAGVLVEGNYFERVGSPTLTTYGDSTEPGRLVERHNVYVECGAPQTAGRVADVPYRYDLDPAERVPEIVSRVVPELPAAEAIDRTGVDSAPRPSMPRLPVIVR